MLFLAYCAKGSNRSNFPWFRLPRWPRWEIASYLYGACKHVSKFLKFPSRQCSASRVLEHLLQFHSLPPKRVPVFQVPPVSKNIGNVKRKFHEIIGGMRCGPARRWVQAHLEVRKAGGKGGCGSSAANEPFEMFILRSSCIGRSRGDCRYASRLILSNLSVFLFSGRGHFKRKFHKKLTRNCPEPCAIYWMKSIHKVGAPPLQWAELEVLLEAAVRGGAVILADDREANKAWCVDRQEFFLYLTSQLFKTSIPGHMLELSSSKVICGSRSFSDSGRDNQ